MPSSIHAFDTSNVSPQHKQTNEPHDSQSTEQDGAPIRTEAAGVTEGDANLLLNLSNVPQKDGPIELQCNDILSGRGRGPNSHSGNVYYRSLIKSEKLAYVNGNPREKKNIISKIMSKIESMNPPGRFLKEGKNNNWELVSPDEARKKTAQALRENAVKIRKSQTPSDDRTEQQAPNIHQTVPVKVEHFGPKNPVPNWDPSGSGFPKFRKLPTAVNQRRNSSSLTSEDSIPVKARPFEHKNPTANWNLPRNGFSKLQKLPNAVNQRNSSSSLTSESLPDSLPVKVRPFEPQNPMANWESPDNGFPRLRTLPSDVSSNQPNSISLASEDPAEHQAQNINQSISVPGGPYIDPKNPVAKIDRGGGFPKLLKPTSAINQSNSVKHRGNVVGETISIQRMPEPFERKRRDPPGNHCDEIDLNCQRRRTQYHP